MNFLTIDGLSIFWNNIKSYLNNEISHIPIEDIDSLFIENNYIIHTQESIYDQLDVFDKLFKEMDKYGEWSYNSTIRQANNTLTCNIKLNEIICKLICNLHDDFGYSGYFNF